MEWIRTCPPTPRRSQLKKAQENEQSAEKSRTEEGVAEHRRVLEDKAIDLMRETDEIVLGRNIGMQPDRKAPAPRKEGEPEKKSSTDQVQRKAKAPKAPKPIKDGTTKKMTKKERKKLKKQEKKEKKRKKKDRENGGGSTSEPEDGMDPDVPTHTQTIPTEEGP